jgi:hypothetical protein
MPCDIILLILSFICYNFLGWKGLTLSSPPKIEAYEEQNQKYDAKWHHGTGKG